MASNTALPERIFMVMPRRDRNTITKVPRKDRRSWAGILDALLQGEEVFVPEDEIDDEGKYLRTALTRRGQGERLRTQVDRQHVLLADGTDMGTVLGRRLWIE